MSPRTAGTPALELRERAIQWLAAHENDDPKPAYAIALKLDAVRRDRSWPAPHETFRDYLSALTAGRLSLENLDEIVAQAAQFNAAGRRGQ